VRVVVLFVLVGLVSTVIGISSMTYGQSGSNQTYSKNATAGSDYIINIRGITSMTEPNMVALISTGDDVQAKKVDGDKAIFEPGEDQSAIFPRKMIDVPIHMDKPVKPNTEVMACVLQLGSTDFSQQVKCNTVFSGAGNTSEPLKIIVPL
jgi:hypothetical protein